MRLYTNATVPVAVPWGFTTPPSGPVSPVARTPLALANAATVAPAFLDTTSVDRFVRDAPSATIIRAPGEVFDRIDILDQVRLYRRGWWSESQVEGIVVGVREGSLQLAVQKGRKQRAVAVPLRKIRAIEHLGVGLEREIDARLLADEGIVIDRERDRLVLRRRYQRHLRRNPWPKLRDRVVAEIEDLRSHSPAVQRAKIKDVGEEVVAGVQARGVKRIGYHYNLHGGDPASYVTSGGIQATRGDIELAMTGRGRWETSVYVFTSATTPLFDVLDEPSPLMPLFPGTRMGSTLIVFDAAHPLIEGAIGSGKAKWHSPVCLDVEPGAYPHHEHFPTVGVPVDTFLTFPLNVFHGTARRLGVSRLSRDMVTLATMRYIEAMVSPA